MKSIFNSYEQSGMIFGTLKIGGEDEKEIYLWGCRGRYLGDTKKLKGGDFVQVYGNFKNGAVVHLGVLNLSGITSRFLYGYIMESNGCFHPIETLNEESDNSSEEKLAFKFSSTHVNYKIDVKGANGTFVKFEKEFSGLSFVKCIAMSLNGIPGRGFIFNGSIKECPKSKISYYVRKCHSRRENIPLTISFSELSCQNSKLTGGKGSSLGKLYALSEEISIAKANSMKQRFEVPKGIVVTTEAYKLFTRGRLRESLEKFQKTIWSNPAGQSEELCKKIVAEVRNAELPRNVVESVKEGLNQVFFGEIENKKFAVRSSSVGEDTEEMSAAGQMETCLGLKGIDEILEGVKKCWSSQFAFQCVEYKRQYGQLLNTPMAVVVQEMVPCEVAGVAFTCDPLSGDPSYINITANWGLGESVVSASSEPDTIVLKRELDNQLKMHSQKIGKKQTKIIMNSDGSGTKEVELTGENLICCLGEEQALQLGQIAVKIEEQYGSPRDLEWGIVGNSIYFLQARPITSLDIDTEFETKHFFDIYMRTEVEYFTKANVGEVMPGATSPLGLDMIAQMFHISSPRQMLRWDLKTGPDVPYFSKRLISVYNHVFLHLIDVFVGHGDKTGSFAKSMMISIFGRVLDDKEMISLAVERHKNEKFGKKILNQLLFSFVMMFVAGKLNRKFSKKMESFKILVKPHSSPFQILNHISHEYQITAEAVNSHVGCTISSSMWNMMLLTLLSKVKGDFTHDVYSDFGYLLSNCTEVVSADVPSAIQDLIPIISKSISPVQFKKMEVQEALDWLQNSSTEASRKFQEFLQKHGHRCLKEFDVYVTPWKDNPKPLVKMLQDFVNINMKEASAKETPSISTVISNLQIELGFLPRLLLRILLPQCRRGVREREFSKSYVIKAMNEVRKPFHCLAEVMVQEGYLPNKELLFFLCIEEIRQLITTRSPRLLSRAQKRWKCHKELDSYQFPEIVKGIPKPISFLDEFNSASQGLTMIGIPVSRGTVKATARVVMNLDEAVNIQPGDILITYSTDIGWSPYFPLLSGIVTELGGLISHGAVVAREYGLPCVVGLQGATQAFKSGDVVLLDGTKGILKRIEP